MHIIEESYLQTFSHSLYPEMVNGWSKSFWARGYYVATVGNITEEAVKEYIQQQKEICLSDDMNLRYVSGFWHIHAKTPRGIVVCEPMVFR